MLNIISNIRFVLNTPGLIWFGCICVLVSCKSITPPEDFQYKEIKTSTFILASWQRITVTNGIYKFYIEGDGHAYNLRREPSSDPTPKGTFLRNLAFNDKNANVIYLARPCQFVKDDLCDEIYWTTARFAPKVIIAETEAIREIAGQNEIILVGYSGGAQVAGLIAVTSNLNIKKLISIAGNLDHETWTKTMGFTPLSGSLSLSDYQTEYLKIPQTHYVGNKDEVIPPKITENFVDKDSIIKVDTDHQFDFGDVYPLIWKE